MTESQQNPQTELPGSSSPVSGYILVAVLTALIVGGGFLYFGAWNTESTPVTVVETISQPAATPSTSTEQNVEVKNDKSPREIYAAVFKIFKTQLKESRQVPTADQSTIQLNKFYYITDSSSTLGNAIWEYDTTRDTSYAETFDTAYGPIIDVAVGSKVLLEWKPTSKNKEIQPVGLSGNNYVFFEQDSDYSAGPCAGPEFWLNTSKGINLLSIDVTAAKPVVKPYTPTAEDKARAEKEKAACMVEILE